MESRGIMAGKPMIIDKILHFLRNHDNFLITTHQGADGDAYASSLAVAYVLDKWNKKYRLIFHDSEKEIKYQFLYGWDKIEGYDAVSPPATFDAAVILDVPSKARIGKPAQILPEPDKCVKIDHHPVEENFAHYNFVDISTSSTSGLVYEILLKSGIDFDFHLATLLFGGIMYDTGRFSYSNTNHRDFEASAHLLQFGVQPYQIANHLFFSNTFNSMKIIGYALSKMESHLNGKLSIIYLPADVMNNNQSEIEELANYSVAIRGVEVGLFIREGDDHIIKISFRSKGKVNVNLIARAFGGGGHDHAAGCRIKENYQTLKPRLIAEVEKQLKELGLL